MKGGKLGAFQQLRAQSQRIFISTGSPRYQFLFWNKTYSEEEGGSGSFHLSINSVTSEPKAAQTRDKVGTVTNIPDER